MEVSGVWDRNRHVDKGKGKEKADDGNADGKNDGNEGGSGNRRTDVETLQ